MSDYENETLEKTVVEEMEEMKYLIFYEERLKTLQRCDQIEDEELKKKLAEGGFFYDSAKDQKVRCIMCMGVYDESELYEDVRKTHMKMSPDCEFLKLNENEGEMTLEEVLKMNHLFSKSLVEHFYAKFQKSIYSLFESRKETLKNYAIESRRVVYE